MQSFGSHVPSAIELLDSLNKLDEHHTIDAKTASDVGPAFFETVCAFANTDGGHILLGARRQEDSLYYEIVPITESDRIQRNVITGCSSQYDRRPRVHTYPDEIDGDVVLVVAVHPEPPVPTQLYIKSRGFPNGVIERRGSTNYHCDEHDIPRLLASGRRESHDSAVAENAALEDIDMTAVRDHRHFRKRLFLHAGEHEFNDWQFLESTKCIDERDGRKVPTYAGVLTFGTEAAIRKHFPLLQVNYIRVPGRAHSESPGQGDGDTVRVVRGNLVQMMRGAVQEITDGLPQSVSYSAGTAIRHDTPTLHMRIAREVIVNALIHRTYLTSTAINVIRYANRIEVTNPGSSLLPIERMGQALSVTRNESIAALFRDARWAETRGTGVGVLRQKMQEIGLHVPVFNDDKTAQFFTTYLLLEHTEAPAVEAWKSKLPTSLTDMEKRACFVAHEIGVINCSLFQSLEFTSPDVASSALRNLEKHGLLQASSDSSGRFYRATTDLMHPKSTQTTGSLPQTTGNSRNGNGGNGNGPIPDAPGELQDVVRELGGKSDPHMLRCAILRFCAWRPLKPSHLARYLGRGQDYLRRTFINELLDDRLLEMAGRTRSLEYRITDAGREWIAQHCGK